MRADLERLALPLGPIFGVRTPSTCDAVQVPSCPEQSRWHSVPIEEQVNLGLSEETLQLLGGRQRGLPAQNCGSTPTGSLGMPGVTSRMRAECSLEQCEV